MFKQLVNPTNVALVRILSRASRCIRFNMRCFFHS